MVNYDNISLNLNKLYSKKKKIELRWKFYLRAGTALVSVATAEVMNIMENVTTISITRAWVSVPEGDVVPTFFNGCNNVASVNEAHIAPVSWAAA